VTRPEADLLGLDAPLTVAGRETRIVRRSGTAERPILRLEGFSSRPEIEAVRGEALLVAREHAPDLGEDEWWADDLVGLAVVDGEREVGVVERVLALPSCEVLVVGELLIPLVDDAVRSVDLAAGRVDVDLGFLGAG
jgi:16S rRNA processing protein RimM